jgi:predicted RNase H-like nuclease (RuvC/YqgF family)
VASDGVKLKDFRKTITNMESLFAESLKSEQRQKELVQAQEKSQRLEKALKICQRVAKRDRVALEERLDELTKALREANDRANLLDEQVATIRKITAALAGPPLPMAPVAVAAVAPSKMPKSPMKNTMPASIRAGTIAKQ